MKNIEILAATINAMAPGKRLTIAWTQLQDLPFNPCYRNPLEHLLELIIGSARADWWSFERDPITGDLEIRRHKL